VGAVAQGKEKGQKKHVGGHPEHSAAPKDSPADHRSASRRTEGSKPAPSHRNQPTDHGPLAVVKEVVAGGGGGKVERTVSPKEVREIIEESESSSGSGSSSSPVQSVLEALGG
jgi:hypothetical protein